VSDGVTWRDLVPVAVCGVFGLALAAAAIVLV